MAPSAVPSTTLRASANSGQASIIRATCAFGVKIGGLKQRAGSVSDCVEIT